MSRARGRAAGSPSMLTRTSVGVTLDVTYPATYPEAAPEVAIKVDKGVSSENVEVLNGIVQEQIAENEGEACIFMIAEGVKEWLIANNVKGNDGSMCVRACGSAWPRGALTETTVLSCVAQVRGNDGKTACSGEGSRRGSCCGGESGRRGESGRAMLT